MLESIIKRDGTTEPFEASKINRWADWASKDLEDRVNWSEVVLDTISNFDKKETTSQDLQRALIRTCLDKKTWAHAVMAGRLYIAIRRKELYDNKIPTVKELFNKLHNDGLMVNLNYSDEDYDIIENIIDHSRDFNYSQYQIEHLRKKNSLFNKITDKEYETPQFTYMRMAAALAVDEPIDRLVHLKKWYDHFSLGRLNAPTPNFMNLGTPNSGYASCCLYTTNDSAKSLAIGDHIAYMMTCLSAGIGGFLNVRSINDPVRKGKIVHQGKLPYFAALGKAVKANLQGGRGGACTTYYSCFDPEALDITMLQNVKTPVQKRNRDLHYAFMYNTLFVKKAAKNEQIFTFNVKTAPDLMGLFFTGDIEGFETKYNEYENNPNFKKNYISARDLLITVLRQSHEVSTLYFAQIDEINRRTSFKEPIHSSNLCVAPETKILTDKGYFKIKDLKDETVNVWNGEEFSETIVRQTSEVSKLIKVITDSGNELDCTLYHKFYTQIGYSDKIIEIEAKDLIPGMQLIKFDLPVIEGSNELDKAYINGFYSGDGCLTPLGQRIYLYGEKIKLKHLFNNSSNWTIQPNQDREYTHYKDLFYKYFVPDASYTIKSRLEWLAGISDSDGCIYRNNGNQQLVINSIDKLFLQRILLMLNTLGVQPKIKLNISEGYRNLPLNDGSGNNGSFFCKNSYRLLITSNDLQKLLDLGLILHRLKVEKHSPQRDARQFIRILDVIDNGRYDETYCFNEPKKHMGVFNGILTGQCVEITQPTQAYNNIVDLYKNEDHDSGEVSLCSLAATIVSQPMSDEVYEDVCYYALKMIDKCIHLSSHIFDHVSFTSKQRLNAGVGMTGLASHMARKGLPYNCEAGYKEIHRIAERHSYYVIKASLKLGKELGNAPWIHKTKWPEGWLPFDDVKKSVNEITDFKLQYDWEQLRKEIIENKGIRNSSLIAYMPCESSSKGTGAPNGLYPIRGTAINKSDKHSIIEWVALDNDLYENQYQNAYEIPTEDMIKVYGIVHKFTDQSISADLYKDRRNGAILSDTELLSDFFALYKYGVKTKYYQNSLIVEKKDDKETTVTTMHDENNLDDSESIDQQNERVSCASGACDV